MQERRQHRSRGSRYVLPIAAAMTLCAGGATTARSTTAPAQPGCDLSVALTLPASGGCTPAWQPTFGGLAGTDGVVTATVEFDDGSGTGPMPYVAGNFHSAGGVVAEGVARWDGQRWHAVGEPIRYMVRALAVFDDGGGPALYAAGDFTTIGGREVKRIAKWDGTSWTEVGGGIPGGVSTGVWALAVHDDGSGAALYVGGAFTIAGTTPANRIAKWDGASWSALGSGLDAAARCLTAFDDGSGAALYAGGNFTQADGQPASRMAKWDGMSWSPLAAGVAGWPLALAAFDGGAGPALYVGGYFNWVSGVPADNIARWNGTSWSAVGSGMNSKVLALSVFDDGTGTALYAAGEFSSCVDSGDSYVAKWACVTTPVGTAYCFGDGSGSLCPCGNESSTGAGAGCANSSGAGGTLHATGSASVAADDLAFHAEHLLPNQPALLFAGDNAVGGGNGTVFGDGLRCAGGNVTRLGVAHPGARGRADWGPGLAQSGGWTAGEVRRFQGWYRDPNASPCLSGFNLTQGVEVVFEP